MTQKVIAELKPVEACIIDDTGFPKKGKHSVGVARQYSGTLGKVDNCQVAVSLNYATYENSFPMDWELYLPETWTDDPGRCEKAHIPKEVKFRHKWQIALELIDRAIEGKIPLGVIAADSAYGKATEFRDGLTLRGLLYAVGIEGTMVFWRRPTHRRPIEYKGRGPRPCRPHYDPKDLPETARQIAESIPEDLWEEIVYGEGTKGPLKGYFTALRVQSAHGHQNNEPEREMVWLLIQRTADKDKQYKYFLLNLDETTPLSRLVRTAKLRWRIEMDYQMLKGEVGLDHYEGRSWPGWNHHVTLVSLAYAFLLLERLIGSFFPSASTNYQEVAPKGYTG
jgi:SRSO17 transposase